jgi:hypothetical protein
LVPFNSHEWPWRIDPDSGTGPKKMEDVKTGPEKMEDTK